MTEKDLQQLNGQTSNLIAEEFDTLNQLYEIQKKGVPANVYLPFQHNIYDIDLNTRSIKAPKFLSVQRDHKAEVIYFKVDRYFDYMDLATTICIIQYHIPGDAKKVPYIYIVPFYDTHTYEKEHKMIFPWVIGGATTAQKGVLEYAVRFYKIDGGTNNEPKQLVYNLNTSSAKSQILQGLEVDDAEMKIEYDNQIADQYEVLIDQLQNNRTFWTILV